LPEAEAKHGYSLDAGSVINKGHSSVSNKYQLAAIDQPSKHLASIKSGGSRGSYGNGARSNIHGRESGKYDRSMPLGDRSYLK